MGFLFDGSALGENEIGGSPTSRGCSSPRQIHEAAVRQHNDQNAERDEGVADGCRCTFGPRCRIADFHVYPAPLLPARYL